MDYQYQAHGGYDSIRECDEVDDHDNHETDYYYDTKTPWQECNEESLNDPYAAYRNEDAFEDETQRPSNTTFFEGASNFVIDGGSFISNSGGNYADFEWESQPRRPTPSSPPSKNVFFKGSSNFVISGGDLDTTNEDSARYSKTNPPWKKSQEHSKKRPVRGLSKPHSNQAKPLKGRSTLQKFSSGPTPTFPEPDLHVASIPISYDPHRSQDDTNIFLPTPDNRIVDVDTPTPILIPRAAPLEDEYRSNDHRTIKKHSRVNPPKFLKSENEKKKITSDPQIHSTTSKLKKSSLHANSSSFRTARTQSTRGGDHDTDYFPPFSMPQSRARDPSINWPSPTPSTLSTRAFDVDHPIHQEARSGSPFLLNRSYTDNPVLKSQPPELAMPQPVRFPDPKRLPNKYPS